MNLSGLDDVKDPSLTEPPIEEDDDEIQGTDEDTTEETDDEVDEPETETSSD